MTSVILITCMFFLSWNVNGLRDIEKLDYVFETFQNSYASVCFVQETFWDDSFIERYKHKWPGKVFYNNCPYDNRKGVAILFSKNFPHEVNIDKCDCNGRLLKVSFVVDNTKYSCVNVYAPNVLHEKLSFFKELVRYLDGENIIVAGDFNSIIDAYLDKGFNMKSFCKQSSDTLQKLIDDNDLLDIWRYRNQFKREFTRQQIVQDNIKQSRIDYIFISKSLIPFVSNTFVKYASRSDHNIVCLKLDLSHVERGQGVWVFQ